MTVRILVGDCILRLRKMKDESVHCAVSSPPYWGLRDYKIEPSIWGGDPECKHQWGRSGRIVRSGGTGTSRLGQYNNRLSVEACDAKVARASVDASSSFCIYCNAWRGCLGLEPTYQLYVEHMVEVFREVWRVLRKDGTLWLNLGDCYATAAGVTREPGGKAPTSNGRTVDWGYRAKAMRGGTKSKRPAMGKHGYVGEAIATDALSQPNRMPQPGLKPKDMAGIPWRVAFALQDDGWWLRRDIIWAKANPMPESVYDRPTTSHEYLFLFSKSGDTLLWRHRDGRWVDQKPAPDIIWRHRKTRKESREPRIGKDWIKVNLWRGFDYYYDFAAIMEPSSPDSHARAARSRSDDHKYADGGPGDQTIAVTSPVAGRLPVPAGWDNGAGRHGAIHRDGGRRVVGIGDRARPRKGVPNAPGANSRVNVDRVPRRRKLAAHDTDGPRTKSNESFDAAIATAELVAMRNKRSVWPLATQAFKDAHFATFPPALIEPCILAGCPPGGTVLDPFAGAGTTGLVADRLQRDAVLIERNPDYADMARRRIQAEAPLLNYAIAAE